MSQAGSIIDQNIAMMASTVPQNVANIIWICCHIFKVGNILQPEPNRHSYTIRANSWETQASICKISCRNNRRWKLLGRVFYNLLFSDKKLNCNATISCMIELLQVYLIEQLHEYLVTFFCLFLPDMQIRMLNGL